MDTGPCERAARQDSAVSDIASLFAFKHSAHKALLDPDDLDAVFAVLLVRQYQNGHAACVFVGQHTLQHELALIQAPNVLVARRIVRAHVCERGIAHVGAVYDKDYGVATAVVRLPESAQAMLAADVPYLEVDGRVWRRKGDGSDILANRRHCSEIGIRGRVCAFYLLEKRRLSRIVQAEEEDRVLCRRLGR